MGKKPAQKLGPAYIIWMMIATRFLHGVGAVAVVYYVNLTLDDLHEHHRFQFTLIAAASVSATLILTVVMALFETKTLRRVLRELNTNVPVSDEAKSRAAHEALRFPYRHNIREVFVAAALILTPCCIHLQFNVGAPGIMLVHITIAAFMGVALSVMTTFFVIERAMQPIVRTLVDHGAHIHFEQIPRGSVQARLQWVFTLITVVTGLMIATLAVQKASDLIRRPAQLPMVVQSLKQETVIILGCAVALAFALSTFLARSVGSRVDELMTAMQKVEEGDLSERISALSLDELGGLGRSFNRMIAELEQNATVIRDLNVHLERKVVERTNELAASKKDLERSLSQLQEYDRLKSEFFSNVSHELRTPLTLILSPVERLLESDGPRLTSGQTDLLRIVQRNTHRLLHLINDLLDFAKLEAGQVSLALASVDVNQMLDDIGAEVSVLAKQRRIQLSQHLDDRIPRVQLDAKKTEKIIANLLSNAVKFTEPGGTVRVESQWNGDHLVISVIDTGIGIAPEDQSRVFERFVQIDGSLSRHYEGTGLGLPLVRELARAHGGDVRLESAIGKGSRFDVTLPAVDADARPEETTSTTTPSGPRVTMALADSTPEFTEPSDAPSDASLILIVDDSADMRTVLSEQLGGMYRIATAVNGQDGLTKALELRPDLIISDVMMPVMDGNELCRHIKENEETVRIPFVMLTAKADVSERIDALGLGADEYLVKPFNARELDARVQSLLKLRRLDRDLAEKNADLEGALEELKQTQDHLIHTEKMVSLGQLVAGIAHEINNSINAVYNGIRPMRKKLQRLDEDMTRFLDDTAAMSPSDGPPGRPMKQTFDSLMNLARVVETGARRTAEIVADLKRFSHPGDVANETFDVEECLESAIKLLGKQLADRIQIHRDFEPAPKLRGSPSRLTQVFMNLLENARQAVPDDGEVRLSTRADANAVVVTVRDNGPGIPEPERARIFDPFFTTKEVGTGSGLGLWISYGIVKEHNGAIEVKSEVGQYTEFTLTLPHIGRPEPCGSKVETTASRGAQHEQAIAIR